MAKGKKAETPKVEKDESYLDYLGIGGDEVKEGDGGEKGEVSATDERIEGLLKTIEGLASRVDDMQTRASRPVMAAAVAPAVPIEPKLREVTLDGLPSQVEDPEGFAKGLNTRIGDAVNENMRALSAYGAETQAQATQAAGRSDQLWNDFQEHYLPKLEKGLPDDVDALAYVEVAARSVAKKAARRGLNLDAYMYQTSETFMEDVYQAADKVLTAFREKEEEEEGDGGSAGGPTAKEAEAHRTGGIIGPGGAKTPKAKTSEDEGSLLSDLREVQVKSGFY